MANLSIIYRRIRKIIFFLIIFYLVRSYYLRKKRGASGGKRISGPPERKRITDGSEKKSKKSDSLKNKEKEKKENDNDEEETKAVTNLDTTETAIDTDIHDEFKKDENHVIEAIENDLSYSITENIKDSKHNKEFSSVDIEKTEIINEIIKENELEERTRQVPVVNNIEIVPTSIIDDIQIQLQNVQKIKENNVDDEEKEKEIENKKSTENTESELMIENIKNAKLVENNKEVPIQISSPLIDIIETKVINDIANQLDEKTDNNFIEQQKQEQQPNELATKIEEIIEEPEKLIEVVEDIIIPTNNQENIVENPEKVDAMVNDVDKSFEESESSAIVEDITEEIIEPPLEESLKDIAENNSSVTEETIEHITEQETIEKVQNVDASDKTEETIEDIPSDNIEIKNEKEKEMMEKPKNEELIEKPKEEIKEKPKEEELIEKPKEEIIEKPKEEEAIIEKLKEEMIEKPKEEELIEKPKEEMIEKPKEEELIEKPNEEIIEKSKEEEAIIEKLKEEEIIEKPKEEEIIEKPKEEKMEKSKEELKEISKEEELIEKPKEEEQETIEKVQNIDAFDKTEKIIEDIPSDNIETKNEEIVEKEKEINEKSKEEETIEIPKEEETIEKVKDEFKNTPENVEIAEKIVEQAVEIPTSDSGDSTEPQIIDDVTEEVIELPTDDSENPLINIDETPRDLPISFDGKEGQYIESLINEIDKVVNDSESDQSFIKEEEKKPIVKNSADIIGHEEIIYEGDVDGDDDGEWVDEDDDGEWVDEDEDDGEWVDEDEDDGEWVDENEEESTKSEITKKPSLLIDTTLNNKASSLSLNSFFNTPSKHQSLHLNTPMDLLMNSLKTPLSTSTTTLPLPVYNQDEKKPKVLPDAILDRIFRETDPQTMWVLRNTSLKTRAIVDNILRETFEQFDLSMDPLYFDVTSKENLGLVLNSLDLSPFALSMLLHEILKLDSQHIGYAFGQMFRVPSKIDIDYLTELIVDTLCILKEKKDIDIAAVMNGLQSYYCFNHSELEFYQLFEMIEMSSQEVARFIQNHHHFILSKSLPPLLTALDVDEVYIAEMCKYYANDDMDSFARIISKVPVHLVRTSIHPSDVQGDRVVMVNENGENVVVVLNDEEKNEQNISSSKGKANGEWEEGEEENMIVVENNESFSIFVGRILRFLNMTTKDVASFLKYLPEYCSYDEDEILEGLKWNEQQIAEMRQIMKEEQDKIARKMKELSKLIIQRRISISNGIGSPLNGSPVAGSPMGRSQSNPNTHNYY